MKKNSKEEFFIQALSMAVKECLGDTAPSNLANQYGISTSTTGSLVNAQKDFLITTIARVAEALNVKFSSLIAMTEGYLPEDFSFYDD